ncbi:MAG: hypothetical protein ACPG51_14375 [Thiolinea sp.]
MLILIISLFFYSGQVQGDDTAIAGLKNYVQQHCNQDKPDCLGELIKHGFARSKPLASLSEADRKHLVSALRFVVFSGDRNLAQTLRQSYFSQPASFSTEEELRLYAIFGEYGEARALINEACGEDKWCVGEKYEVMFRQLSYSLASVQAVIALAEQTRHLNGVLLVAEQWVKYGCNNEAKKLVSWALLQKERPQWNLTQTACDSCYYDRLKASVGLDTKALLQAINALDAGYFSLRHVSAITAGFIAAGDKQRAAQGLNALIGEIEQHPGEVFADPGHPWRGDAHRYVAQVLGAYLVRWSDYSTEQQLTLWIKQLETGQLEDKLIAFDLVRYYSTIKRFERAYAVISALESGRESLLLEMAKQDQRTDSPLDTLLGNADKSHPDIAAAYIIRAVNKERKGSNELSVMTSAFDDLKSELKAGFPGQGSSTLLRYFACVKPELAIAIVKQQAGRDVDLSAAAFSLAAQNEWQKSLELLFEESRSSSHLLAYFSKLYYMGLRGKDSYYGQKFQCT